MRDDVSPWVAGAWPRIVPNTNTPLPWDVLRLVLLNVFCKELCIHKRTSLLFHNMVRTFPPQQSARVHRYSNVRCDSYGAFDNIIHNIYR